MRNPWKVLGVPRGSDRDTIRRAYAAKLKQTNPEDDPDGFKKLREAYEWASQMVANDWVDAWEEADEAEPPPPAPIDEAVVAEAEPLAEAEPEPVDSEAEELNGLLRGLAAQLGGERRDDDHAVRQFEAIMAHPGLDRIDYRAQAEYAVAHMIADHVPSSDGILLQAIKAFEWDRLGRGEHWPFSAALARHQEWKLISAFNRMDQPLHKAWMLLNGKSGMPRWLHALTPTAGKMHELIEVIDYESPGLAHSVSATELEWWRARLERPTFNLVAYFGLVAGAIALGSYLGIATGSVVVGVAAPILLAAAVAVDQYGRDGGYGRLLPPLFMRQREHHLRARLAGSWPWLFALLPVAALAVPAAGWGVIPVLVVAVAALVAFRLSGEGQPVTFGDYWGAAAIGAVVLVVLPTLLIEPAPSRLLAIAVLAIMGTQPLASAGAALVERLDGLARGQGGIAAILYGAVIGGLGYWAAGQPLLSDPVSALAVVGLTWWGLVPIVGSARQSVIAFLARGVRVLSVISLFMLLGAGNPVIVSQGMSNGEALVAWKMGLSGELPFEFAERMRDMERGNPELYAKLMRHARTVEGSYHGEVRIRAAVDAADRDINQVVPHLLPVTSDVLAAQYQQAKVALLENLLRSNARRCAAGELVADSGLDPKERRVISDIMLEIAARGRIRTTPADPGDLPTVTELDYAAEEAKLPVLALKTEVGASNGDIAKCRDEIARQRAIAVQPPHAIAALFALKELRR